jgi:hypothetical protein
MLTLPSPERCQAIAHRLACYDFPWDVTRSLELALFRTFASPRIAGVLLPPASSNGGRSGAMTTPI